MPDFRAFGAPPSSGAFILARDESHHLVAVNRARVGDPVIVFNGRGKEWECRLTIAAKGGAKMEILRELPAKTLPFRVSLAQALPKGTAMDGIIRKATEIGAERIFPLETERTQVHLEGGRQDKKREKWDTAAIEAAKQCGNPWVPEIQAVQSLSEFLEVSHSNELRLFASLHSGAALIGNRIDEFRRTHGRLPREILSLIGPEGDFSPGEISAIHAAGFLPITLGPLVLRCETAAAYALSVASHAWLERLQE